MEEARAAMKEGYSKYIYRKIVFIIVCVVAATLMFFVSLCVGTLELTVPEVYQYFFDHLRGVTFTDPEDIFIDNIVWNFRVPRALFAIVAGIALAVAGTVMQSVMKNPLADPYTTGVSSGALFGVAIAMILGFAAGSSSTGPGVVLNAILFSMVPIAVIVIMAPYFRKSPASLILAGVAVSYLFNSLTSLLMASTSMETLAMVYKWQVGTLYDLNWDVVPLPLTMTIIGLVIILPLSNKLNIMALDDKDAKSLGLNVEKLRVLCLIVLAMMTSVVISYVGIIGFVGLVVPHIIRLLLGADNKFLLPAAGAFGAVFLLGCDIIGRAINLGVTIPVGVVTSFLGAPIFMMLIIANRRNMW